MGGTRPPYSITAVTYLDVVKPSTRRLTPDARVQMRASR
jgi:hypothetical protein